MQALLDVIAMSVLHRVQCCHVQVAMSRWFLMPMPPLRMQPAFTALTCTFSHASLAHLAFNMIAFSSFGGNMSQVHSCLQSSP